MDISSTPFIRNDYFPDYNDINELNQRIDEVENEISLVNIRLSNDIENVSNNLNTYINSQADTTITNNVIVNNLNANYAMGDYLNFGNVNFNNAYIENLTVNKPVFDITLNTAHIENTTSLGGNFYNPSLINPSFSDVEEINSDNASFNNAIINNLFVNVTDEPISSSAVLGYDSDGRVIPIHATYDVSFPEGADYLYTDSMGVAKKGTASTEVSSSLNLITSYGVKNAIDSFSENVGNNLNIIYDSLNDIDQWENTFENITGNTFNNIFNSINEVNDYKNTVNDSLNNINNDIDSVLSKISFIQRLSDIEWDVDNTTFFRSDYPLDYTSYNNIYIGEPDDDDWSDYSKMIVSRYNANKRVIFYNSDNKTVYLPVRNVYPQMLRYVFKYCRNFNQPVEIPNTVTNTSNMFAYCRNFNQPVDIPNSVTDASSMFDDCNNFNQPVDIPNSVTNASHMFDYCSNFNQTVDIPNSVTDASYMLHGCSNFNQPVEIPNTVTNTSSMFDYCDNFNQPVDIPNSVTDASYMFVDCSNFNQPTINIYSDKIENMEGMFTATFLNASTLIRINHSIPKDTSNYIFNCLVNGFTGVTFTAENIHNDLT